MAIKTETHETCKTQTYSKKMWIKDEDGKTLGELKCVVIPNRPENGFFHGNYFVSTHGYEFYVCNGYEIEDTE